MLKISATSKHHPLHTKRRAVTLPFGTQRFLAAFEGVEGGFAIGASIVVALSVAGLDKDVLMASAIISIIVSGFNTASVKYSTEHYLDQLDGREKRSPFRHYFVPSFIEFVCYVVLSIFSVLPFILLQDTALAAALSVGLTLVVLFAAGLWRGYMLHMDGIRDGLETVLLGMGIITIGLIGGIVVGSLG